MSHRRPTVSGKPDTQPNKTKNNSQVKTKIESENSYRKKSVFTPVYSKHSNNKNNIESVKQRLTFNTDSLLNKSLGLRSILRVKKTHSLGFRASDEEVEAIDTIMRVRGFMHYADAIREAVRVYASILSGAKDIKPSESGALIIQNPVINLVDAKPVAIAKSEVEADEVLLKQLKRLRKKLAEYNLLIKEYETEISRLRKELELREARIRELEARLQSLEPEAVKARVEAEVVKRLKNALYRLARLGVLTKEQLSAIYTEMGW